MYNNIGKKIKGLALIIAIIFILIGIVFTILGLANNPAAILVGLLIILLGWLSGFGLYGFGELVDTNMDILKKQDEIINTLQLIVNNTNKENIQE